MRDDDFVQLDVNAVRDWFLAFALVLCATFLAYHVGEMRGKAEGRMVGYQYCLGEQDDDRPRYATGGKR